MSPHDAERRQYLPEIFQRGMAAPFEVPRWKEEADNRRGAQGLSFLFRAKVKGKNRILLYLLVQQITLQKIQIILIYEHYRYYNFYSNLM